MLYPIQQGCVRSGCGMIGPGSIGGVFTSGPQNVVTTVVVGSGSRPQNSMGVPAALSPAGCIWCSFVVVGAGSGNCSGIPNGSGTPIPISKCDAGFQYGFTRISGCQSPLETGLRQTKNIFSRPMNPSPILQNPGAMGCDSWESVLSNTRRGISQQRGLATDSKYRPTLLATSYASLLRVIGSRFLFRRLVEI